MRPSSGVTAGGGDGAEGRSDIFPAGRTTSDVPDEDDRMRKEDNFLIDA